MTLWLISGVASRQSHLGTARQARLYVAQSVKVGSINNSVAQRVSSSIGRSPRKRLYVRAIDRSRHRAAGGWLKRRCARCWANLFGRVLWRQEP